MKNFKGFTLIELLVVISIIGVISSVVLVSFSGSRDKAKLAKAQQFDAQVSHALGAYTVGIWRFEENAGTTAYDESGYGNNAILNNGAQFKVNGGVYSNTNAVEITDDNDYIQLQSGVNGSIITITMWYYFSSVGGGGWNVLLGRPTGSEHHLLIFDSTREIGFYNGPFYSSGYALKIGQWHHLALAKNGSNSKLYVNGDLKQNSDVSFDNNTYPLETIGNYGGHNLGATGIIDNVCVFDEILSVGQIQQHYVQGAASHGIAINGK